MKRAEVACVDKVRSLSERKSKRDSRLSSQVNLDIL